MAKRVGINQFFEKVLRAPPKNPRWSWGAVDRHNRVFLRIWEDNIERDSSGERVLIYRKNRPGYSHGQAERGNHIDAMKNGAPGYGVVCRARDRNERPRRIAGFRKDGLVRFGPLLENSRAVYSSSMEWISINDPQIAARPLINRVEQRRGPKFIWRTWGSGPVPTNCLWLGQGLCIHDVN
jgi:hypothetical protein